MKKVISALLAITAPIWILPAVIIVVVSVSMYEAYKDIHHFVWGEK